MKKRRIAIQPTYMYPMYLTIGMGFFLLGCAPLQKETEESLMLWYDSPAQEWTEALPVGNGRLGAMIFGGIEQDRIQFNEETLWNGGPRDYHREGAAAYLPEIRRLLAEGKQAEAEELAEAHFMGMRSNEQDYESQKQGWQESVMEETGPAAPGFDDSGWEEMELPVPDGWERSGLPGLEGLDGALWFKTRFELPQGWEEKELVLSLGRVRDLDRTYLNGRLAGSTEGSGDREYRLKPALLNEGENELVVQVINFYDKGGLTGARNEAGWALYPAGQPEDAIPLPSAWSYWVQDDDPPLFPQYAASYQPFGDLILEWDAGHAEQAADYRRELDLSTAVSSVSYRVGDVRFTREYLSTYPDQAVILHLTADEPAGMSFQARLGSKHRGFETRRVDEGTLGLSVKVRDGVLRGESYLGVETEGGQVSVTDEQISIEGADEVTLFLTAATSYQRYNKVSEDSGFGRAALEELQKAREQSYKKIRERHVRDYRQYFNTLTLDLGEGGQADIPTDRRIERSGTADDPSLAALYLQYARYLLISSSRPGTHPANLQGIWNDLLTPPWGSKYTANINVEMNYWPAEVLNLQACHEPLFSMIGEVAESGRETARAHYGAPGWVMHHNTDLWRCTAPINAANHGIWVGGSAWLCHHLWEHYLFTQDTAFLKNRAYPVMKDAARFYADFLVEEPATGGQTEPATGNHTETGWLISTPSNSPELGGLVAGPTMDHQLIRELFASCIRAAEILDTDEGFRELLAEKRAKIAPNQIGRHGQLQEWLEDIDDPEEDHRHVSHLWGMHPGSDITWENSPELMEAARQSLQFRGDGGTGWSLAWKINFWARFKDGDHARYMLDELLQPAVGPDGQERGGSYPNLFDAHPPFQIDGNFGGAAGIAEMLVQSHQGFIELLPALPEAWQEGNIRGVCARGGFILNIRWEQGRLQELEITSRGGNSCHLRYQDHAVEFDTERGETYRLNGLLEPI